MSGTNWRKGRILTSEDTPDISTSAVLAEVYSQALSSDDGGLVGGYVLVDNLDFETAEKAMYFFCSQVGLLLDKSRLVEDCRAEYPALVVIRCTDDLTGYLATANQYGFLQMLPDSQIVCSQGWDLFCAREAMKNGEKIDDAAELAPFDYRTLRRKVYANRALTQDDRFPWFVDELDVLKDLTSKQPDGSETFVAMSEDMEAALKGDVDFDGSFAIVIPTKVERRVMEGPISEWLPQVGREVVVAHGLDAIQAARALALVEDSPETFVNMSALVSGPNGRETLCAPIVVADTGLSWIGSDLTARRNAVAYERLRMGLNGPASIEPDQAHIPGQSYIPDQSVPQR